jgi:ribonuclease G
VLEDEDLLTEEEAKIVETEREIRAAAARGATQSIDQLLKQGQEVLVQVVKEPLGTKGARITSYVSLPGRLLVYMPTVDHIGVSRKIESAEERVNLRKLIQRTRQRGGGYIVRTAAQGKDEDAIVADLRYLENKWQDIGQRSEHVKAPALIHRDLGLVFKYIRDVLSPEFSAIRINSEELFDQVLNYVRQIQPQMLHRVKYYSKNYPILDEYGVQSEIDKALRSKVWLKSGGYIVINQTEALVAIDINTGRYTGERRLEDTITRINLEAVEEIVHQIRLRDLGGIIVIDFIDMEERRNQQKVFAALEQALRKDRSPTKSVQINEFGLVILTRKRVKRSLERVLCRPCPHCQGSSWVKSPATVAFEIVDQVRKSINDYPKGITLKVHPEVARALRGKEAPVLDELKSLLKRDVDVRADNNMYEEQYELVARR